MDAAVIRERTQAAPNGRVGELPPDADPTMTRAAREKRAAWRLEHLDAWFRGLEELDHHDPEYEYDVAHEYEYDWTTDPDYGVVGVDLCEFDEDGVIILPDPRAGRIQYRMCDTACDALGNRVEIETHVHYRLPGAGHGGRRRRVKRVRPDLMVLPSALELPPEEDLDPDDKPDRALRLHEGDPPPELVLEILSEGGAQRDLDEKLRLYADLGVVEYLVYDLGGKRTSGSKVELLVFRLTDGAYRRLDPDPAMSKSDGGDAYWSDVFGTHIRMQPDRWRPRFQWYDPVQGRWRDRETDEQHRIRAEGREAERVAAAVSVMREFLESRLAPAHLDLIEAVWRKDGPPMDAFWRIRVVQRTPDEWRSLLQIPDDDIGSERMR